MLPHARWRLTPAGCTGCWLATMKLDSGQEFRVRLDRFRFWFEVQGYPGCYVFPDGPQKEAFVELTRPGGDWIHSNGYRWTIAGAAREEDR